MFIRSYNCKTQKSYFSLKCFAATPSCHSAGRVEHKTDASTPYPPLSYATLHSSHNMKKKFKQIRTPFLVALAASIGIGFLIYIGAVLYPSNVTYQTATSTPPVPKLNILAYNKKLVELANYGTTTADTGVLATSSAWTATTTSIQTENPWPVSTVYPQARAILPFSRIVGYYGNFLSTQMGVLGQYPEDVVFDMLSSTTAEWQAADPSTPVIPAVDYIAVVAQGGPGPDGKYRLRMPDSEIEKAIALADRLGGIVFLDVQPGLSNVEAEVPLLEKYLEMPEVELALDPEFSMKDGVPPGKEIGTMDASDINYAANYLAHIVQENNLPPKILLVHRFTEHMVTNYQDIQPLPQVQIVLSMDGWGTPERKERTYSQVVFSEPIQFTGIKLFYKNDLLPPSTGMLSTKQVLSLKPAPIFVEYQ